jgi:hypothetical protein
MQPAYILDDAGGCWPKTRPPDFVPGQRPFTFDTLPQLAELFYGRPAGERDLSQLRYTLPGGQLVNLFPLVGDEMSFWACSLSPCPCPPSMPRRWGRC